MDKKVLIGVENRFIKGILVKSIAKAEIGLLDIFDFDDMTVKLEAFGKSVVLAVLEVNHQNIYNVEAEVKHLRSFSPSIPIIAIVYKDTADIVSFAIRMCINDILLLPKKVETYSDLIQGKMHLYYEKINMPLETNDPLIFEKIEEKKDIKESLNLELRRAIRGKYPLSFVIAYLSGHDPDVVKSLIKSVESFMRDTDKLFVMDEDTFIVAFPFTQKVFIPTIEEKFRDAFKIEFPKVGIHKKLCLYSATFPHDGDTLEELLERLEKGINNSMVINSVNTPLSSLTQSEIENYKKMIKQYRRFF